MLSQENENFKKAKWKQYRKEINDRLRIRRTFENAELEEKIRKVITVIQEAPENHTQDLIKREEKLAEEINKVKIKQRNRARRQDQNT